MSYFVDMIYILLINILAFLASTKFIKYAYKKKPNEKLFEYGFYFYFLISIPLVILLFGILIKILQLNSERFIFNGIMAFMFILLFIINLNRYHYRYIYKKKDIKATDILKYKE